MSRAVLGDDEGHAREGAGLPAKGIREGAARPDTLLFWLAQLARHLRNEAGLNLVHIAAAAGGVDQSTISRFERGESWPYNFELVVAAYAEETGVEDPREIWELALGMWREHGEQPTTAGLAGVRPTSPGRPLDAARKAFERAIVETAPAPRAEPQRRSRTSRARRSA